MITSSPGSRTLSWESVTTTATSMSLSPARSSPVISQSIQTRLLVALSATTADPTHRRPGPPAPGEQAPARPATRRCGRPRRRTRPVSPEEAGDDVPSGRSAAEPPRARGHHPAPVTADAAAPAAFPGDSVLILTPTPA